MRSIVKAPDRWLAKVRSWALATCMVCALVVDATSQQVAVPLVIPASVGDFTLRDSTFFEGDGGRSYRYTDRSGSYADVYIYPVPRDRQAKADTIQLQLESAAFVESLTFGPSRGWFERYEGVIDTTQTLDAETGQRPFQLVAFAFAREGGLFVSFMHLFLVGPEYLKVRLTLPAVEWETSVKPNFAIGLALRVVTQTRPSPR